MVKTPLAVANVCMLAEGYDRVWCALWLCFSFDYTRGAQAAAGYT